MSVFLIPLVNNAQTFEIELGGNDYIMTCKWNNSDEAGWVIDLSDATTGDSIVAGLPLITGADILENIQYLGFNGSLYIFTDGDDVAVPTLDNLGVQSNLYFQTVGD